MRRHSADSKRVPQDAQQPAARPGAALGRRLPAHVRADAVQHGKTFPTVTVPLTITISLTLTLTLTLTLALTLALARALTLTLTLTLTLFRCHWTRLTRSGAYACSHPTSCAR